MNRSIVIAVVIALGAAGWVASGALSESNQPEQQKPPADLSDLGERQKVRTLELRAETYQRELVLRGSTQADRKVQIKAESSGRVIALNKDKGDFVKEGELLLQIAPEDRPAQLREAEALREQRRIEVEAARKLADKGYRSQTELAGAEAALQAADAAVERAQVALDNLKVLAPFDGRLETREVELGDYLDVSDPVGELVDLDPIKIVGFVNERETPELRLNAPGIARFLTGDEVSGTITYIAAAADPGTRTFRVELSVPNPAGAIPDGMTAEMILQRSAITAHRLSPAFLTLADNGQIGVRLVTDEAKVAFRPVKIVGETREVIWVTGLPATARVIVVGQEFVREGDDVEPYDAETLEPVFAPAPNS
ncbi:efflux RND transporter periplasmic adaptor subunit [Limibacillus halophilus]|jgi:multidrug efflux system membrane fusion protein